MARATIVMAINPSIFVFIPLTPYWLICRSQILKRCRRPRAAPAIRQLQQAAHPVGVDADMPTRVSCVVRLSAVPAPVLYTRTRVWRRGRRLGYIRAALGAPLAIALELRLQL